MCQTNTPLLKDVVKLGHLFIRLDALTKVDYSHGGFPYPACVSLYKLLKHMKIWKARMLAQQHLYETTKMTSPAYSFFLRL